MADATNQAGAAGPQQIRVPLASNAADTMRCLFFNGPTWDGNVPSKCGRDELVSMGLAARGDGYQWLTPAGMRVALAHNLHREKEAREAKLRQMRNQEHESAKRQPRTFSICGDDGHVITSCEFRESDFDCRNGMTQLGTLLNTLRIRYPHAFLNHIPGMVLVKLDELQPVAPNQMI